MTYDDGYLAPDGADVVMLASYGVDGIVLRVPQLHAVCDRSLLGRPRIAIVGARGATPEGRRRR
jgi:hypothetical protein